MTVGPNSVSADDADDPPQEPVEASTVEEQNDGVTAESVIESVLRGLCYPIFTVDAEGTIDRINEEGLELFGKTRDDLIGACLFDFDEADNTVMREVLDTGEPVKEVESSIVVDGEEIPVSRSLMPIFDEGGGIAGALEINRDITERVELRRRERVLEEYQEAVVAELESSLARLSEGDLTIDPTVPEPDEEFEAIQNVYEEFDGMASDLREAVQSLVSTLSATRDRSDELADVGAHVENVSAEARNAIQDLNDASVSVAAAAERQAEQTADAEQNVSSLSASIEEITATVEEIDARANEAADLADAGTDTVYEAIETIDDASTASERNVEMIASLEERMETINRTIGMIADIADQTNLLALNANIEAARADGDGAGFKVVANEVKALAEESKDAVAEISSSLEAVKDEVSETAEAVATSNSQVEIGVDAVREVVEDIEDVEVAIRETSEGIEEIRLATADQAEDAEVVSGIVEDVSEAGHEVSAEIQEVAASVDQQADAIEEVASASETVTETSNRMNRSLADFRLRDDETATIDGDAAADD